ncbi:MAG: hypothetical protein FWH42_03615 [Dehalococcoidia bacterium]|nr:hypothetical protein [Dehalococcoidia bacterium]
MTTDKTISHSDFFEAVWQSVGNNIENLTSDATDQRFLKSIVMGGSVAAEALVSSSPSIKHFWQEGTQQIAQELSLLFSHNMLTQLYQWVKNNPPTNMVDTIPKEITATRIIHVFNGDAEKSMADFMHFDQQLSYDFAKHPHLIHSCALLLARCSEICGHPCIDWDKVDWPVVELTHLTQGAITDGAPMRSKPDMDAMLSSLNLGGQAMLSYYSGA